MSAMPSSRLMTPALTTSHRAATRPATPAMDGDIRALKSATNLFTVAAAGMAAIPFAIGAGVFATAMFISGAM